MHCAHCQLNAVAPDWNLKLIAKRYDENPERNAVAPDWNLK